MSDHLKLSFNLILSTAGNLLTFLSSTPQLPTPNSPLNIKTSIDQAVARYHASLDQVEIEVTLAEHFLLSRLEELKTRNALQQTRQQSQEQQQQQLQRPQSQQPEQQQVQVKKEPGIDGQGNSYMDSGKGLSTPGFKVENGNLPGSINISANNSNSNSNINTTSSNSNDRTNSISDNSNNNNTPTNNNENCDVSKLLEEDTDLNFLLKDADVKFDEPIEMGVTINKNVNNNNGNINPNNHNSNPSISSNTDMGNPTPGSLSNSNENPIFIEDEDIESLFNDNFYQP
ncbi:hypothetical protein, no similarity [Geotrichum candidum]|uniref:Uncharacterized protein n=1 Tax=Geotrichum candidum TaxID=1173061 RepID=A0A0J9XKR5_GEOCN|nr:hypothetical protein, no similarity [Geotrichum candidum]